MGLRGPVAACADCRTDRVIEKEECLKGIRHCSGLVQVAGILNLHEARMLLDAGVDLLGFPLGLDHHEEDIAGHEVARIVGILGLEERGVLITYLRRPGEIAALVSRIGVRTVQLHGPVNRESIHELRRRVPGLSVIKSLIVRENNLGELKSEVRVLEDLVDAFITDTFDPGTGASGATGRTHDWDVSRRLAVCAQKPLILAGGLSPRNVHRAILTVRPFGVDAHTGLEGCDGRKDPARVEAFVKAAKLGFAHVSGRVSPAGE